MKCPLCGCRRFYFKDPDDPFEIYPFEVKDGQAGFDPEVEAPEAVEFDDGTETFCDKCSWHGPFQEIEKN